MTPTEPTPYERQVAEAAVAPAREHEHDERSDLPPADLPYATDDPVVLAAEREAKANEYAGELAAEEDDQAPELEVGSVVRWDYHDPYTGAGGADACKIGVVIAVDDDGAQVAWLGDVAGPLPVAELTPVD